MKGNSSIDVLMIPVGNAISRHIQDFTPAYTDIYNRAYEALLTMGIEKDAAIKELQRKNEHLWNVTKSSTADNERLRRALEEITDWNGEYSAQTVKVMIEFAKQTLENSPLIGMHLGEGDKE
ncbi:hypothetical protein J2T12_005080 [Paenibacillus anaericanus]|uniref:hypothetical protein n=1 Tax=Paenibacillus anaericanus TaxID=170367 RepID=UPI0027859A99|nr:hypothetical protein [Paenibacillus anaericanus]MDQ0091640.1 hypothetical protein [Paenibacillus anaericanus]